MSTEVLDIRVRESGTVVVTRNLDNLANASQRMSNSVDRSAKSLTAFQRLIRQIGAAYLIKETLGLVDAYQNLNNRLAAAGIMGDQAASTFKQLLDISNQTRSSVRGTTELFARLAISTKELGTSQEELMVFTKGVNEAILLSGASAKEAENGLIQLSQGMASNRLSGDELRSVLEQLPIVASVIAKEMGVTRGELRKLGAEGKITADIILDAFKNASGELDAQFKNLTPTMGQSLQVLKNNLIDMVGEFSTATGIIPGFAHAIRLLADNLRNLAKAILIVTSAWATWKIALISQAVYTWIASFGTLTAATGKLAIGFRALWIAAGGPVAWVTAAIAGLVVAIVSYRDRIAEILTGTKNFGAFMQALKDVIGAPFIAMVDWAKRAYEYIMELNGRFKTLYSVVKDFGQTTAYILGFLLTPIMALGKAIFNFITWPVRQALNAVNAIWDAVKKRTEEIDAMQNKAGTSVYGGSRGRYQRKAPQVDTKLNDEYDKQAEKLREMIFLHGKEGQAAKLAYDLQFGALKTLDAARKEELTTLAKKYDMMELAREQAKEAEKRAEEEANITQRLRDDLNSVVTSYDNVFAAQIQLADATDILEEAHRRGWITLEQYNMHLQGVKRELNDQLHPFQAIVEEMDKELELLRMSSDERMIAIQLRELEKQVTADELVLLEEKLKLLQEEARISAIRDEMRRNSVAGRDQEFQDWIKASQTTEGTEGDEASRAVEIMKRMGLDTATMDAARQANVELYAQYLDQIRQLQEQGLISEADAARASAQIWAQSYDQRTAQAQEFLGGLAELQHHSNKEMALVGKAAAITQATISTYGAAVEAFKAMSGIPIVGPFLGAAAAASAVAMGMQNIAKIRAQPTGFATGGSMIVGGHGGTDSQTVAFRATPGERVQVNTPAQARALARADKLAEESQRSTNVTQNLTMVLQGRPDRRTTDQLARAQRRSAQREWNKSSSVRIS